MMRSGGRRSRNGYGREDERAEWIDQVEKFCGWFGRGGMCLTLDALVLQ